jgi:predicted DNA-binding transcriptional regulator AlpA
MNKQELPLLLDIDQMAFHLGLSARTIELRQSAGCLPGLVRLFGRNPRWRRDVILQWIAEGCPPAEEWTPKAQEGAIESFNIDGTHEPEHHS